MTVIEQVICKYDDIIEGELQVFEVGPGKVLVAKHNGSLSAVSHKCTHYGAPLNTGAYSNGKVRCPWHGACFNVMTGDIEDFPGLDSLQKHEILVKDGSVIVRAEESALTNSKRVKETTSSSSSDTILIIGGGGAAIVCAETLRQNGYSGNVIMATKEPHPPYDRPKLSKMLNSTADKLYLRTQEFIENYNVHLQCGKEVVSIDVNNNLVRYTDGNEQAYTHLFIASGGKPRKLNVPGNDLKNIFYLRSPEDANAIHSGSVEKDVVILGTGFIGMEIAAYLTGKAKSVTVVGSGRSSVPFKKQLGSQIGNMYLKMHTDKGVAFRLDSPLKQVHGKDGKVCCVELADGSKINADVIVSGIGVTPSTEFAKDSGISMDKNGHIIVDQHMRTNIKNIFAGGDIVSFPYCYDNNKLINVGHWQLASAHGRCAGLALCGKQSPIKTVPFFWTQQFGKSLRYTGHCDDYDDIVIDGNVDEMKFSAFFCRNGKIHAMACMNMGAKASEMAFRIESGVGLDQSELAK